VERRFKEMQQTSELPISRNSLTNEKKKKKETGKEKRRADKYISIG